MKKMFREWISSPEDPPQQRCYICNSIFGYYSAEERGANINGKFACWKCLSEKLAEVLFVKGLFSKKEILQLCQRDFADFLK